MKLQPMHFLPQQMKGIRRKRKVAPMELLGMLITQLPIDYRFSDLGLLKNGPESANGERANRSISPYEKSRG